MAASSIIVQLSWVRRNNFDLVVNFELYELLEL